MWNSSLDGFIVGDLQIKSQIKKSFILHNDDVINSQIVKIHI